MVWKVKEVIKFFSKLSDTWLSVEIEKEDKKLKKSMSYANKINVPYVIVIGEDELASGKINIKNMESGDNTEFALDDISGIIGYIKS